MSYFSTAFDRWLDSQPGCTQQELADESSITQSNLSRVRAGKQPMTLKSLTKLLPVIEARSTRAAARTLLVAYLRDETPANYCADVQILPQQDSTIAEDAAATAPDPLDIIARRWRARAEHDPEFAEMWITLDGYMHSTSDQTDAALAQHHRTSVA